MTKLERAKMDVTTGMTRLGGLLRHASFNVGDDSDDIRDATLVLEGAIQALLAEVEDLLSERTRLAGSTVALATGAACATCGTGLSDTGECPMCLNAHRKLASLRRTMTDLSDGIDPQVMDTLKMVAEG